MSLLGTKTKRVLTYGRKGHRIINAPNEKSTDLLFGAERENLPMIPVPRILRRQNYRSSPSPKKSIPTKAAVSSKPRGRKSFPVRHPLALYEPNTPGSPAQRKKKIAKKSKSSLLARKQKSPLVDLDIIIIDDDGKQLSQERRVSRTDIQVTHCMISPLTAKTRQEKGSGRRLANRPAAVASPITVSSDTEEDFILNKSKFTKTQTRVIVISSDESDSDDDVQLGSSVQIPPHLPSTVYKQAALASSLPHAPYLELHTKPKQRQLTPIRCVNRQVPSILSPSPSVSSNLDETFADISISSGLEDSLPAPPKYLLPLLSECRQSVPHEFSAFIETFPFDPIIRYSDQGYASRAEFRKIGEASYSEVFGIGNVVLKVVPLRDEEAGHSDFLEVDSPPPSDAQDVLKEINVTRSMGEICEGFIKLLRAYVVRGKYPSLLLSCWDEFNETKGSESIKPDTFPVSQTYAIIVLPNGGPDLEAYTFSPASKKRWSQASSIFWQVVRALGIAEGLVSFEHRDLHWGQILVQNLSTGVLRRLKSKISMDDDMHGVSVTIIDLGLARMNASKTMTHWTPLEPELFEGKGDYQFDIYRLMKEHNGDSWAEFRPLTNAMWLHYLLRKLLSAKKLRPPAVPRKTAAVPARKVSTFTERECYQSLVEMEALLTLYLDSTRTKKSQKGRQKTVVEPSNGDVERFTCARDVLNYGITKEWVSA